MTSAHRPTLDPAKGKMEADTGIVHSRAMPAHMKLKMRRNKKAAELAEQALDSTSKAEANRETSIETNIGSIESKALENGSTDRAESESTSVEPQVSASVSTFVSTSEASKSEAEHAEPAEPSQSEATDKVSELEPEAKAASEIESAEEPDSEEEEDDSESEEVLRQLENIQRNQRPTETNKRKRAWMDETVFSNETSQPPPTHFVNDSLHTDVHRNFMKKHTR